MKKRMLCFISGQLLPNFIPVNEGDTRPDVLHAIYTPLNPAMKANWENLQATVKAKFPAMEFEETSIMDEYDPLGIKNACEALLANSPHDAWVLNATGGTKLMSSPAIEAFKAANRPIIYVETPKNRTLVVKTDWATKEIGFRGEIDIQTYFQLHGRRVSSGQPTTNQERHVLSQLQKLDWRVWSSVRLFDAIETSGSKILAEFDLMAIRYYQLHVFECKRLNITTETVRAGRASERDLGDRQDSILLDLYKLAQVRQMFGGPFGRIFWVFTGRTELTQTNQKRIEDFGIKLISGNAVNQLSAHPENFGLPPKKES